MGYTAASTFGLGLPVATGVAALSGLASAIDIKKDFLGFRSIRKDQSPFQYLLHAHRELVQDLVRQYTVAPLVR